jgi:two-component system chemotaxis response regulator CheB
MSTDGGGPRVEVVVLLASAGGLDALCAVLGDLPTDFPAAVVVQQHLGGHTSVLPAILSWRTNRDASWAVDGQPIRPRHVSVCPAGVYMELKPDGTCSLRTSEAVIEHRFDVLLTSVARSYGPRALAVVLSGAGRDGAAGTVAMKRAGGIVIAQSQETAQYPSMPIAAAEAGADSVLPLYDIGRVLVDIETGGRVPDRPGREAVGKDAPKGASRPMEVDDQDVTDNAAARSEAARRRVAELKRRRQELAAGQGSTPRTVAEARSRAADAFRRAEQARHIADRHAAARRGAGYN